jgi:hypothetical protein
MADIQHAWATIRQPSNGYPLGEVAGGFYRVEHDVVVLVDENGREIRDARGGGYRHKLVEGQDACQQACRLIREAHTDQHGTSDDFNRNLNYSPLTI